MKERQLIVAGSVNMFLAVAAGAFGAHGLRNIVSPEMLGVWQTAVTYHLIHGLGLLIIALLMPRMGVQRLSRPGTLMLLGLILFSGSLYVLVLSGIRILGVITPLGGVLLLLSWLWLALAACRAPAQS